jgi:aarF domain-containing kinase
VFWESTSKRILTAEWIDGIRFSDTAQIIKSGFSIQELMGNIVKVFSDQIFRTGFVHCDPHPGNIIIRPHPRHSSLSQVVILDHGLYVTCSPQFTHDYAVFWKSIFLGDQERMHEISKNWGMSDLQLFASATLQKTWVPGKATHISEKPSKLLRSVHNAEKAKERLRNFLKNTELVPKELIFIGRNMNCVRANNRSLGSPVNRINIMAHMAVSNLGADWTVWNSPSFSRQTSSKSWSLQTSNFVFSRLRYLYFKIMLWTSSFAFNLTKVYQYAQYLIFGIESEGFEAIADAVAMKKIERELGLKIDARAFSG